MKISYITTYDASDIQQWSGLGYYIAEALKDQQAEIDLIGGLNTPVNILDKIKARLYNKLGKRYLLDRVLAVVRNNALQAEKRIGLNTDVLFSPSTLPIGLIKTNKPKVFYTDATFAGMIDFYPSFSNLCAESVYSGNFLEQAALDTCALAIYSSHWAAQSAIDNYHVNPEKVKVVPFGANIECNRTADDIRSITADKRTDSCNLLFIGVEWERKGGAVALEVTRLLNERGLKTTLHIVGAELDNTQLPSFVVDHGYISKTTPTGAETLNELLATSHFLILPTRADCTPVVYSEANSFGLPCISTNVGGIPGIIEDGVNGKLFSLTDSAEKYADYVESLFLNYPDYIKLSQSTFNEYRTRLNWETTGKSLMTLLRSL